MRSASLFAIALLLSIHSFAQDRVWKKEVSRIIDIGDPGQEGDKHITGTAIFKIIANAVATHNITPYSNDPRYFLKPLGQEQIDDIMLPHDYQNEVVDPITGNRYAVVTHYTPLKGIDIYKYKLLEDWTFDPATATIDVQIKYIGAMIFVYGNDGMYRGKQTMFWISYNNFVQLMGENKAKHLQSAFDNSLWQSYFGNEASHSNGKRNNNTKTGDWQAFAMTAIEFHERTDTDTHYLVDERDDTSLGEYIFNGLENNKITAWPANDLQFSKPMSKTAIFTLNTKIDTATVIDPVTNNESIVVITTNGLTHQTDYNILEKWMFDPSMGKTKILLQGISSSNVHGNYGRRTASPFFWVKYTDIQPILAHIDQYNPDHTFAMHIWNSFFLSDIKPILIK